MRVCIITTYEHGGYLEVTPLAKRSERSLWLSLHAEVHYNSICASRGFPRRSARGSADARLRCADPAGEVPQQGVDRVHQLEKADSARAAAEQQRRGSH